MFDSEARLLYVGKAKNLKKRLPAISARPAWRPRPLRWWAYRSGRNDHYRQ
jgi:hypothetical protein